mmetsp:Transcript_59/g.130  ORF Transcript_59/g.130 Transcript_59/m.130 type:complete len:328 (-) Transcript_59:205-1188(-)
MFLKLISLAAIAGTTVGASNLRKTHQRSLQAEDFGINATKIVQNIESLFKFDQVLSAAEGVISGRAEEAVSGVEDVATCETIKLACESDSSDGCSQISACCPENADFDEFNACLRDAIMNGFSIESMEETIPFLKELVPEDADITLESLVEENSTALGELFESIGTDLEDNCVMFEQACKIAVDDAECAQVVECCNGGGAITDCTQAATADAAASGAEGAGDALGDLLQELEIDGEGDCGTFESACQSAGLDDTLCASIGECCDGGGDLSVCLREATGEESVEGVLDDLTEGIPTMADINAAIDGVVEDVKALIPSEIAGFLGLGGR